MRLPCGIKIKLLKKWRQQQSHARNRAYSLFVSVMFKCPVFKSTLGIYGRCLIAVDSVFGQISCKHFTVIQLWLSIVAQRDTPRDTANLFVVLLRTSDFRSRFYDGLDVSVLVFCKLLEGATASGLPARVREERFY